MADKTAPEKIKQLFSSFLSTFRHKENKSSDQRQEKEMTAEDKLSESENDTKTNNKSDTTDGSCTRTADLSPNTTVNTSSKTKEKPATKSNAWNKSLFYDRVETYSSLSWFAKPLSLSPLVCARYGWINTDTDMLQCVNCRALLSGQLPKAVDSLGYRDSCSKLEKSLTECHEKLCTWSSNPSPESFMNVPIHSREELFSNYCSRVASLLCKMDKLPSVAYASFDEQGVVRDRLDTLIRQIMELTKSTIQEDIPLPLALFALCGWSYSGLQVDVLLCNYCRRKVGLWNYSHVANGVDSHSTGNADTPTRETTDSQPPKKRPRIEKENFDPIGEHRYWCPWIQTTSMFLSCKPHIRASTSPSSSVDNSPVKSPSTESSPIKSTMSHDDSLDKEPAWLLAMTVIAQRSADGADQDTFTQQMRQSPQVEGLRHLRKVLRDCTSPGKRQEAPDP